MSGRPMTPDEADDWVSENGTGTPRTKGALQAQILADMAEDIDRQRGLAVQAGFRAETEAARRENEERADILQRRRDALYNGALALRGVTPPDIDAPLTPPDYGRLSAGRPGALRD